MTFQSHSPEEVSRFGAPGSSPLPSSFVLFSYKSTINGEMCVRLSFFQISKQKHQCSL